MQRTIVALPIAALLGAALWPSLADAHPSLPLARWHARSLLSSHDSHAGHDHGGNAPYEWAGLFETPQNKYVWTSQKTKSSDGSLKYVDPSMKVVMLKAADKTEASLKSLEAKAKENFALQCEKVQPGGTFGAAEDKCYELVFGSSLDTSSFTLDATGAGHVGIFTAHVPTEFERDLHYLHSTAEVAVEPLAQTPWIWSVRPKCAIDWKAPLSCAAAVVDPHAGHDHGDPHAGHDHGDPHAGHDHGRRSSHDAHAGHDHGDAHAGHDHGDPHAGHDHGGAPYEWAGLFETPDSIYEWTSQKAGCGDKKYADPAMQVVVLKAVDGTEASLKSLEAKAKELFKDAGNTSHTKCENVTSGATFRPSDGKCYQLVFNDLKKESKFSLDLTGVGHMGIFTAHKPTEFEDDKHYLHNSRQQPAEPLFELPFGYEWAGLFATPESAYVWTSQKTGKGCEEGGGASDDPHAGHDHGRRRRQDKVCKYVDATMKVVLLKAANDQAATLKSLEAKARQILRQADQPGHFDSVPCIKKQAGQTLRPTEKVCYELMFSPTLHTSPFALDTKDAGHLAIFTAHGPTEFERDRHYLQDSQGKDIEPLVEIPKKEDEERDKYWGEAILAALCVNLCTLIGVILLVPGIKNLADKYPEEMMANLASFAGGAILACAFFLLLFEATHYIAAEWKKEVDAIWRWGTMILAGFLTAGAFEAVCVMVSESMGGGAAPINGNGASTVQVKSSETEMKDANAAPAASGVEKSANGASTWNTAKARVIGGVLFGDALHNLCDGVFIGSAFHQCGNSFGWKVAGGAILHELAQELSDYAVLTNEDQGGFKSITALALNFISGLTVLLGVIIVLAAGEYGNGWVGLLLAYGGGVYLHIGAAECAPKMYNPKLSKMVRLGCLLSFIIGTVVIGLVLLDHEHCIPDDGSDAHAGHNH